MYDTHIDCWHTAYSWVAVCFYTFNFQLRSPLEFSGHKTFSFYLIFLSIEANSTWLLLETWRFILSFREQKMSSKHSILLFDLNLFYCCASGIFTDQWKLPPVVMVLKGKGKESSCQCDPFLGYTPPHQGLEGESGSPAPSQAPGKPGCREGHSPCWHKM